MQSVLMVNVADQANVVEVVASQLFFHLCLLTDLARSLGATSQIELFIKSSGKDCQNAV